MTLIYLDAGIDPIFYSNGIGSSPLLLSGFPRRFSSAVRTDEQFSHEQNEFKTKTMQLTISTGTGDIFTLDVSDGMEVGLFYGVMLGVTTELFIRLSCSCRISRLLSKQR